MLASVEPVKRVLPSAVNLFSVLEEVESVIEKLGKYGGTVAEPESTARLLVMLHLCQHLVS